MRALLCHCHCRLEAEDVEDLRELVRDHLRREHPAVALSDKWVEELVARSYRYECVEVYAGAGRTRSSAPNLTRCLLVNTSRDRECEGAAVKEVEIVRSERTKQLTREVAMLLDLALSRSRADGHADGEVKELIRGALEAAKQEIVYLEELVEESERGADRSRRMRPRRISEKEL